MPPQRQQKKRKPTTSTSTSTSSSAGLDNFPNPPQLMATKSGQTPTHAPRRSPSKPDLRISQAQKQAIIDNLQLEITERARKLRAQYALQAQGLRTRLEIRIHRIPASLRTMKMGELYERHARTLEQEKQKPASTTAHRSPSRGAQALSPSKRAVPHETRPARKRNSDHLEDEDKENTPVSTMNPPPKRIRAASPSRISPHKPSNSMKPPTGAVRAPSRRLPNTSRDVLSPRSNNSRTFPQSPYKAAPSLPSSPYKSNVPRPVSPLKPTMHTASSMSKTAEKLKPQGAATIGRTTGKPTTKSTTGTVRGKRNAANANAHAQLDDKDEQSGTRTSSASNETSTSAGTTIVKKSVRGARGAPSASKTASSKADAGTVRGKKAGVVKRMAAGINAKKAGEVEKPVAVPKAGGETVKGGRTLRKRA